MNNDIRKVSSIKNKSVVRSDQIPINAGNMPPKQIINCSNWNEFHKELIKTRRVRKSVTRIYRGQANPNWPLWSKWQRSLERMTGKIPPTASSLFSGGKEAHDTYRDSYLELFKDRVSRTEINSPEPPTKDDWWGVARHHGLITPLLDWTFKPYVAAYFALIAAHEIHNPNFREGIEPRALNVGNGIVAIWELALDVRILDSPYFHIINSRWLNRWSYRLRAQSGVPIRFEHDEYLDLGSWLKSIGQISQLRVLTIPEKDVPDAILDLRDMGISDFTMFPDIDGAARESNVTHRLEFLRWYPERGDNDV